MFRRFLLSLPLLLFAAAILAGQAGVQNTTVGMKPSSPEEGNPTDSPWRFVFSPNGELWVMQYLEHQSESHWNFGAEIEMEIARGRGHRLWFGARYELRAGYREGQEVTPFDPRHVDSYQLFTWRMAKRERREVFLHLRRVCFHEIDVHNPGATWTTHAALGIGTMSPPEKGESLARAQRARRTTLDGFLSCGPFAYGGPAEFLGNLPEWEWESSVFARVAVPVTGILLIDCRLRWDHLRTTDPEYEPGSDRLKLGLALTVQRERGGVSLLIERILHDNYPLRGEPVGWRVGLQHLF